LGARQGEKETEKGGKSLTIPRPKEGKKKADRRRSDPPRQGKIKAKPSLDKKEQRFGILTKIG